MGVAVGPGGMPGTALMSGDRVRVVLTPARRARSAAGSRRHCRRRWSALRPLVTGGPGTQTVVSVLVPESDAATLASWASTGKVAVILDSRER